MKTGMGQPEFNFDSKLPMPGSGSSMEQSEKETVARKYNLYGESLNHLHKEGNDWFYDTMPIEAWTELMKELDQKDGDYKNY